MIDPQGWTVGALREFLDGVPDDVLVAINTDDPSGRLRLLIDAAGGRWWPEARSVSDEPEEDGDGTAPVVVLMAER